MSDTTETENEPAEMDTVSEQRNSRESLKRINVVIGYIISVLVACGVMMWSVFNIWLNVLMYRADSAAPDIEKNWSMAALVVIVTCVVPFLLGVLLLFKTLNKQKKPRS